MTPEDRTEATEDAVHDYVIDGGDISAVLTILRHGIDVQLKMMAEDASDEVPVLASRLSSLSMMLTSAQQMANIIEQYLTDGAAFRAADRQIGSTNP
ncbi:hypothetical protein [Nitrospira sp. Nam74]